jgi:hypothetical protein
VFDFSHGRLPKRRAADCTGHGTECSSTRCATHEVHRGDGARSADPRALPQLTLCRRQADHVATKSPAAHSQFNAPPD